MIIIIIIIIIIIAATFINVIFSKLFHFLAAGVDPVIFGVSDYQGFAVHHSGS